MVLTDNSEEGSGRYLQMWCGLRQMSGTCGALFVSTGALAFLFGVPLDAVLRYLAYQAAFTVLPGMVVYSAASRRSEEPIIFTAKVVVVGQCIEMTAGLLLTILGFQSFYIALPLLYIWGAWILRCFILRAAVSGRIMPVELSSCLAVGIFLVFSASLFNFDQTIDQHFTWVAAFANAVVSHWPPVEPFLMDVPLHYHYLFNVHVGLAAKTAGIPLILVASRLAILFHALAFVLMLYAVAKAQLRWGWLGIVAATAVLLTFGYSEIMWGYFHFATASTMYRVASTMIAFQILLFLIHEVLASRERRTSLWLLAFLIFVAGGVRAMMLPMLLGGVGLLALSKIKSRREFIDYVWLILVICSGIFFSAGFFLGLGEGGSDGTRLLFFNPLNLAVSEVAMGRYSPLVVQMLDRGVPSQIASALYLVVATCGRMSFLLPFTFYAYFSKSVDRNLKVLLSGVALTGVLLLIFVQSVVPQEIWAFYWFADVVLALLGAAGLKAMLIDQLKMSRVVIAGLVAIGLLVVQVRDFSLGFSEKLAATSFPTQYPAFRAGATNDIEHVLAQAIATGDILVTGGRYSDIDDRTLVAGVPGLQLYASRGILSVYALRTKVDERVSSRLWILDNSLGDAEARQNVRRDVGPNRALFLLWLGTELPTDSTGLSRVAEWSTMSLWRVD